MTNCPTCGHDSDDDKRKDEGDPRVRVSGDGSFVPDRHDRNPFGDES